MVTFQKIMKYAFEFIKKSVIDKSVEVFEIYQN